MFAQCNSQNGRDGISICVQHFPIGMRERRKYGNVFCFSKKIASRVHTFRSDITDKTIVNIFNGSF